MAKPPTIVVLGAGCAGLAAAWRLLSRGKRALVVEEQDRVGGLAGGIRLGDNVYEYGPHIFHTTDPEILSDVKGLMGDELIPFRRTIQIKFLGSYFRFPLSVSDVLFKLPPTTVLRAFLSLAYHFALGALKKPAVETSETVLRRYYGDVLYDIFFKEYITKVWGIPPSGFSPAFARERIPRLNLLELLDKAAASLRRGLGGSSSTEGYVEKVEGELYSTRQGFSLITQRMAERLVSGGSEIRLKTRALRIERAGERVTGVAVERDGKKETIPCEALINTLPINEAALSIHPGLGTEAERAARALRFRATVFLGLKVRRPRVLKASFMYFREHSFNRVTDLSHFGHDIEPGCTLLVAEVNCDPTDRLWKDEELVKKMVVSDLEREELVRAEEILEIHVFRSRHAYPIYTLGYEKALALLLGKLDALRNFETAGRQGRFQYVNTHIAMKMGYQAADRLLERRD